MKCDELVCYTNNCFGEGVSTFNKQMDVTMQRVKRSFKVWEESWTRTKNSIRAKKDSTKMLNTKNKIHYFINIFFFVVFLLHVSLVAFNSMNPANPSLKVSKKKLEKLEYFPISLKLCAKKASSVDNVFRKFGYSHDYKFFIGKSYYNASIKGWNGHTRNGTTIASYTFLKATT